MRYTILFLLTALYCLPLFAKDNSPVGYWKTIDDVSGKPKSIIKIWESDRHELFGKIVRIFPKQGDDQKKLCTACQGDKHNQPIVGMVILTGLKQAEKQWEKGKILDPVNGRAYNCIIKPYTDDKRLLVRGYIGLPLLGRTQTWERADPHQIL